MSFEFGAADEPVFLICGRAVVVAPCRRKRSASMAADRRNSVPVTASQCQRNGSADKVVEA
jgi:hypothetical protein